MIRLYEDIIETPCGALSIVFDDQETLLHLDFPAQGERQHRLLSRRFKKFELVKRQSRVIRPCLEAYMAGDYAALAKISCNPGGTQFQRRVWQALQTIPVGQAISYRDLAIKIGNPKAVRAVARANALNPISLIYPCHRVIGANGRLTGYAGGLERKSWLLNHEGVKNVES